MPSPEVAIILLNYNGWNDTIECLQSIFNINDSNFQVIVVDNNSPDNSMNHIKEWAEGRIQSKSINEELDHLSNSALKKPISYTLYKSSEINSDINTYINDQKLVLIKSEQNGGFAAGNNIGLTYALARNRAVFVWLLNNDTVIEPNTLKSLIDCSNFYKDNNERIGIIGAKLLHYYYPTLIQAVGGIYSPNTGNTKHLGDRQYDNGQFDYDISKEISYPVGASLFVSVDFVKDVGLMCEDYFLYYEELDWVIRGKEKNWGIGYCWKAKIYHKEGASIGSNTNGTKKSQLSDFYGLRNKLLFTSKYFPSKIRTVKLTYIAVLINRLKRKHYKSIPVILRMLRAKPEQLKNMHYKNL